MWQKFAVPFWLFLLIFGLVALGWGEYRLLDKGAAELLNKTARIHECIMNGEWPEAEKTFTDFNRHWQKYGSFWPMLINHQEMDRIEESISRLRSYLQNREINDAQAELYNLNHLIRHIPEKESFSLRNIL